MSTIRAASYCNVFNFQRAKLKRRIRDIELEIENNEDYESQLAPVVAEGEAETASLRAKLADKRSSLENIRCR